MGKKEDIKTFGGASETAAYLILVLYMPAFNSWPLSWIAKIAIHLFLKRPVEWAVVGVAYAKIHIKAKANKEAIKASVDEFKKALIGGDDAFIQEKGKAMGDTWAKSTRLRIAK